jgi:hypothetical protein
MPIDLRTLIERYRRLKRERDMLLDIVVEQHADLARLRRQFDQRARETAEALSRARDLARRMHFLDAATNAEREDGTPLQ